MRPIGWRLFYGNGKVVSSAESTWQDAPADDVQVVVEYYDEPWEGLGLDGVMRRGVYIRELHGGLEQRKAADVYWLDPASGSLDHGAVAPSEIPPELVKRGKTIDNARFWRIYERAHREITPP